MNHQISIIGCGWLGFPLAKYLISNGYTVKGSTTSIDKLKVLQNAFIEGFIIKLNEKGISGNYDQFLSKSETIIINIPPGLRKNPNKNHVHEIRHLITAIQKQNIKNVLYISSTSVFKDEEEFPIITNLTKPNSNSDSSQQLIQIEQMLQSNPKFKTTILRFGGLFDAKRHPAKYLSGKTNISNPNAPINLIHKEDCIAIISTILKRNLWNETLNAVHTHHPTKKEYYTTYCKAQHIALPHFNLDEKNKGKLIDSSKMVQLLNYSFKQTP